MLDPPDPPTGTVTGVGTTVGTVAIGEDSTGAIVLTTAGLDASLPPATEDATEAAVEDPLTGTPAASEVAGVEPSTAAAEVAGVELSTGAADDAGVVDSVTATPHAPRGLLPGNASNVPRMVSSIGH